MTRDAAGAVGRVWLVGAGPGDPGLITVAGLERLRQADVVVYDRLVSPQLLVEASAGAELIFVGKKVGERPLDQQSINDLLIAKAREGKTVVRLKGGDPFVFGRGGEEAQALQAATIPFAVVPGITSATAVPAYAGIPVTHRGLSSSFAVITGHEDPGKDASALHWDKLATAVDTIVFLMGTRTLPAIVDKLIQHGLPADTPVAVVQWGTTPQQRTVVGTLTDITQRVEQAGLVPPTIAVVGQVVGLRQALAWYEGRPLFGKRVLITRTRRQASALARLLALEGAAPVELPAIEIRPAGDPKEVTEAIQRLAAGRYQWVVFTSVNGVELFFAALADAGGDARAFAGARVCAIGPATAEALAQRGIVPDALPSEFIAEGIIQALRSQDLAGAHVLLPRAEGARRELVEGLAGLGAQVHEVVLYRAAAPSEPNHTALAQLRDGGIDIVTFTSSSTVLKLVELLGGDTGPLKQPLVACIGPVTAETARQQGFKVDIIAREHSVPGLVEALRQSSLVKKEDPYDFKPA